MKKNTERNTEYRTALKNKKQANTEMCKCATADNCTRGKNALICIYCDTDGPYTYLIYYIYYK